LIGAILKARGRHADHPADNQTQMGTAMSEDSQFGRSTGTPAGGKPAGQDYGFFAATPVAAPTPFGSQPRPASPPVNAGPPPAQGQFGGSGQFGGPGQFGAPAPFGAPMTYGPPSYPAAPRRGLPVWAIVAICVPAALVVLGILAAVAVPVFLNQRDKAVAAATTVAMPPQINGMATSANASVRAQVQDLFSKMPACTCFDPPVSSVYVDTGSSHVVVVGAAKVNNRFSADNRADFVRGFWSSARSSSGAQVGAVTDQDAGSLGGSLSCAPLLGGATGQICVAVDAGSYFFVVDIYRVGKVDPGLPVIAREAIVHRT
jgi:hypothetical protein